MSLQDFFSVLWRQSVYAGILFCLFCLLSEVVFPGFAAPFIHIPLLGLIFLAGAWFAAKPDETSSSRIYKIVSLGLYGLLCIGLAAYLLTQLAPLGSMAWIRFGGIVGTMLVGATLFFSASRTE